MLQLQNNVNMKPRSQIDDQQLLQLNTNSNNRGRLRTFPSKKGALSADTFDTGDGSTHKDDDDHDVLQAEALRKANEAKAKQMQALT